MADRAARRRHSAFAAALATVVMAASLATAPAQAADKTRYFALGDSYAAGQGAGPYLDTCYRSENAYSELAEDAKPNKPVENVACSGNKTQDVVDFQLSGLNKSTKLVTITAGGNNIGFGNIIVSCSAAFVGATPGQQCETASTFAASQILSRQLYRDVVSMIEHVQAAAPKARIVVTGYPYLLDPIPAGQSDALSLFIYKATELSDGLNATISQAADHTGATYIDVRPAFLGHGALSQDRWINIGTAENPDSFHPNAKGYEAYYSVLRAARVY